MPLTASEKTAKNCSALSHCLVGARTSSRWQQLSSVEPGG
jgi:hypothetical protein